MILALGAEPRMTTLHELAAALGVPASELVREQS
jgi:hypothetical protein